MFKCSVLAESSKNTFLQISINVQSSSQHYTQHNDRRSGGSFNIHQSQSQQHLDQLFTLILIKQWKHSLFTYKWEFSSVITLDLDLKSFYLVIITLLSDIYKLSLMKKSLLAKLRSSCAHHLLILLHLMNTSDISTILFTTEIIFLFSVKRFSITEDWKL